MDLKISTKAGAVQKSREVIILNEENIELYSYGDIKRQLQGKQPTIEDVYFYLYEGWSVYDDPLAAMGYCSVTSPRCLSLEGWRQWKHDHYVGDASIRERALKDPLARLYLKRFGLLSEDEVRE